MNFLVKLANLPTIKWTYNQLSDISKVYAQALHSNLGPINKAIVILPKIPVSIILHLFEEIFNILPTIIMLLSPFRKKNPIAFFPLVLAKNDLF